MVYMNWSIRYGDSEKAVTRGPAEGTRITTPNILSVIVPSQHPSSFVGLEHFTQHHESSPISVQILSCTPGEKKTGIRPGHSGSLVRVVPRRLVFACTLVLGWVRLISGYLPVFETLMNLTTILFAVYHGYQSLDVGLQLYPCQKHRHSDLNTWIPNEDSSSNHSPRKPLS